MNLINKKVLAASAVAIMLLPFAASAHEGNGLKLGSVIGQGAIHANVNANVGNHEGKGLKGNDNDNDNDGSKGIKANATSTVGVQASTTIATKVTRINETAAFMTSLSPVLSARIASSTLSASSTAAANAQLADYNTNVANAKAQVSVASVTAANIKTARDFLNTARQDLMSIIHAIFNA